MNINGPGIDIDIAAPDPVEQLLAAPDAARLFHERGQQPEFGRPQFQLRRATADPVGFTVQRDIFEGQHLPHGRGTHPAQLGPDAGQKFADRIGFDHVIVGSGFQPTHPVHFFGFGRDHDDRNGAGFGPGFQLAAHFDPRHCRQHPVEHDHIRQFFFNQKQGFFAIDGSGNTVAFGLQIILQNLTLRRLVFDNEDKGLAVARHHVRPWLHKKCGRLWAGLPAA